MKKKKCALCSKAKARRKCNRQNQEFICSRCCADMRDSACEGCPYFADAKRYRASKAPKAKRKEFIIEINEEVEAAVDNALALVERGNVRKAERIFENLQANHPKNYMVNYGIGVVNAFKQNYDQAIVYFTRATENFPYFIEAHFNKAVAFKSKLDVKNAIRSFKEVIEIGDPETEIVEQARQFVVEFENQVMETEGIELNLYLEANDEFDKAFSYMQEGEWHEAITGFHKCIKINEKHPQSYGNLGLCYAHLGRKTEALDAFDRALEIDPKYELAVINKAVVESLSDGEALNQESFESIDYHKDYPMKKKSYVRSVLNEILGR